jgi:hypothetical protein
VDVPDILPTPAQAIELKRKRAIDEQALRTIFLEARPRRSLSPPI